MAGEGDIEQDFRIAGLIRIIGWEDGQDYGIWVLEKQDCTMVDVQNWMNDVTPDGPFNKLRCIQKFITKSEMLLCKRIEDQDNSCRTYSKAITFLFN